MKTEVTDIEWSCSWDCPKCGGYTDSVMDHASIDDDGDDLEVVCHLDIDDGGNEIVECGHKYTVKMGR